MRTWVIFAYFSTDLPSLRIRAHSFDEALAEARLQDQRYCGGYVVSYE